MLFRTSTGDRRAQFSFDNEGRNRFASVSTGPFNEADPEDEGDCYTNISSRLPALASPTTALHMESLPSDTGPITCVQDRLPSSCYTEFDLFHHLQHILKSNKDTVIALGDLFRRRNELTALNLFSIQSDVMVEMDQISYCEIFDVGQSGVLDFRDNDHYAGRDEVLYSASIWNLIRDVNIDDNAVGRITILQRPCPATFASIHLTMKQHFDMDEVFSHLISNKVNKGKTTAYMLRAFEADQIRQRSCLFVFKYYTVIGEGLNPAPWQRHDGKDPDHEQSADHVNISECSSIVALSLGQEPTGRVPKRRSQPAGKGARMGGAIYDPFAPFHVLNIQWSPDAIDPENGLMERRCYSGPHAFLECLAREYKAAVQRLSHLCERIEELVIPTDQFMFDLKLRDKLLFEDNDFTFSRRYFWAYNSLDSINDSIKAMIRSYSDTFTPDFWLGKHAALWPHPDPEGVEGRNYLAQLGHVRHELESSVGDLRALARSNEQLKEKVEGFREQLYSGSSVKENRIAVEQGENIKILTSLSMLFLPLSFVTSVFGMQLISIPPNDWRFAVILVAVCIPFFVLVFVLQTNTGLSLMKRLRLSVGRGLDEWKKHARVRRSKRSQLQHAAMIRKQSCASSLDNVGRRGTLWNLIADKDGQDVSVATTGGQWWRSRRKGVVRQKVSNV